MIKANIIVMEKDLNRSFVLDDSKQHRTNCNTLDDAKQSVEYVILESIELDELNDRYIFL